MKIDAVNLMRSIRDKMAQDVNGMTWREEQEYLRSHIKVFESLSKGKPNKAIQPTPKTLRVSGTGDG